MNARVVNDSLAMEIGLNEALLLQELYAQVVASQAEFEGRRWVYKTYEQWQQHFPFWTISTVRRIFRKLEKLGYVLTERFNNPKTVHTKWYTIDFDKTDMLKEQLDQTCGQSDCLPVQNESVTTQVETSEVIQTTNKGNLSKKDTPIKSSLSTLSSLDLYKPNSLQTKKPLHNKALLFFEQNGFGKGEGHVREAICNWINELNEDLVLHALTLTREKGVASWGYAQGILRNWKKQGISTVEQLEPNHKTKRTIRKEIIPDWYEDHKKELAFEVQRVKAEQKTRNIVVERRELEMLLRG